MLNLQVVCQSACEMVHHVVRIHIVFMAIAIVLAEVWFNM